MKVLIVTGEIDEATAPADELETLYQADCVARGLRSLGHETARGVVTLDLGASGEAFRRAAPEVVFNLVESVGGRNELYSLGAIALELLGVPFTGSGSQALMLAIDKLMLKRSLRALGLPTAPWVTPGELAVPQQGSERPLPSRERAVIVKAAGLGSSIGLDDDSVLRAGWSDASLAAAIAARETKFCSPFFAETFLEGRELKISLIPGRDGSGIEALPIAEIDYSNSDPRKPPILTWARTWGELDPADPLPWSFALQEQDPALCARLEDLARRCFNGLGLRGWARIDVRLDRDGEPFLLDVNANCSISPDAGLCASAQAAGMEFTEVVDRILKAALRAPS